MASGEPPPDDDPAPVPRPWISTPVGRSVSIGAALVIATALVVAAYATQPTVTPDPPMAAPSDQLDTCGETLADSVAATVNGVEEDEPPKWEYSGDARPVEAARKALAPYWENLR